MSRLSSRAVQGWLLFCALGVVNTLEAQCPMAKLEEPSTNDLDDFGFQVCLDGNLAVISELGEQQDGAVHFQICTGPGRWVEVQEFRPSDGYENQLFGIELAMDQDVVVVGAPANGKGGDEQGSVYVLVRNEGDPLDLLDDVWIQASKLVPPVGVDPEDGFGRNVAISGGTIAIGHELHNGEACYLFERHDGGTADPLDDTWVATNTVFPDGSGTSTDFGQSVAFSTDGSVLFVGDRRDQTRGSGAVYVFHRDDAGTPATRLDDTWVAGNKVTMEPIEGAYLGKTVAVDGGDWLFAGDPSGGPEDYAGQAHLFQRNDQGTSAPVDDTWDYTQTIVGSTVGPFRQGFSDAMDVEGDRAVIGHSYFTQSPGVGGECYVFENQGGTWVETMRLSAPDQQHLDRIGNAVALDGSKVLLGAHGAEYRDDYAPSTGAAYEFDLDRPSPWERIGTPFFQGWPRPHLSGVGCLEPGSSMRLRIYNGINDSPGFFIIGFSTLNVPFKGETLVPALDFLVPVQTGAWGHYEFVGDWSSEIPAGLEIYFQAFVIDGFYSFGVEACNALKATSG